LGWRIARVLSLIGVVCASIGSIARADAPSVLVIAASGSAESQLSDAVREAVAELDEVKLLPAPPLDLEAAQLAIDCSDESPRCMGEIATRMGAQIVIVPSLKKRSDALELHLKCFKQRTPGQLTTAMRKQAGARLDSTLLAAVPSMVREVLELSRADDAAREGEPEPEPELTEPAASVVEEQPVAEESSDPSQRSWLGPLLLGGGGVALIAGGVVFGAMASASEDDYASREIDTVEQAESADAVRETGESQALAANLLLVTGSAALVAAGVWYLVDRPEESAPETARLIPVFSPHSAGLVLTGHFQP
jgi:hypothetical protein